MNPILNDRPDPRLVLVLRRTVIVGAALVLAMPAARGYNPWLGAMPLWLLAMPLARLWALHGFCLPTFGLPAPGPRPALAASPRPRRRPTARPGGRLAGQAG